MLHQQIQRTCIVPLLFIATLVIGCEKPVENTPLNTEPETAIQPHIPPTEPRTIRTPVPPVAKVKQPVAPPKKKMHPRWTATLPVREANVKAEQWVWAVIASQYEEKATLSTFKVSSMDKANVHIVDTFGKDRGSLPAALIHPMNPQKLAVGDWVLADRPDTNAVLGQVARIVGKDTWVRYDDSSKQRTALFPKVEPVQTGRVALGWTFFRTSPKSAWFRGIILVVGDNQVWIGDHDRTVHIIKDADIRPFQWMRTMPEVGTTGWCAYRRKAYEKCVVKKTLPQSHQIEVQWPDKKTTGTIALTEMTTEMLP